METKFIVVPFDFTEEAACALNHANGMAAKNGAEIVLTHILDKKSVSKLKDEGKSVADLESKLKNIADENALKGIKTSFIAREGDIFHTITNIADEMKAMAIVFGTHGVKGLQHLLGANSLKIVTNANMPVIIVQRRAFRSHGYKKIIYPVDENVYSKQKAYAVAAFAKMFDSEVIIVPKNNSDEGFMAYTMGNLRYSKEIFEERGVRYTVAENLKTGGFAKVVIEYAASQDADLIAITTQESDEKDIKEIFIGNEEVKIINNDAEIPALCINAVSSLLVGGVAGVS